MIDGVFGEAAVAGKTFRAMPFFEIAVIQARGVPTFDAVLAALAPLVYLDGDAVADLELIDARSQRRDGAGIFMAHDKFPGGLSLERAV